MRTFAEKVQVVSGQRETGSGDGAHGCPLSLRDLAIYRSGYTFDHADRLRSALPVRESRHPRAPDLPDGRLAADARRARTIREDIASLLGHTTALNVLLGANQKGAGRVTLQVQGSGPVKLLVADCTAELRIRGMASLTTTELGRR